MILCSSFSVVITIAVPAHVLCNRIFLSALSFEQQKSANHY